MSSKRRKLRVRFLAVLGLAVVLGTAVFFGFAAIPVRYAPPGLDTPGPPSSPANTRFSVLTANVGNSNLRCLPRYSWRLCFNEVEERIAQQLQTLQPDIVTLQELTHPDQCVGDPEEDSEKLCYAYREREPFYPARRLLGASYTIACENRYHRECIAVHVDAGSIPGCDLGGYCEDIGRTAIAHEDCNDLFTISAADVVVHDVPIRVVNAHPENRNVDVCRTHVVRQIFEPTDEEPPLASGVNNILAGDFNMDPFRTEDTTSELWHAYVGLPGAGRPFTYHSGPAEQWPPYDTFELGAFRRILDHVASDFASGSCVVLGTSPNTERLDAGQGMDHRAVFCELGIPSDR